MVASVTVCIIHTLCREDEQIQGENNIRKLISAGQIVRPLPNSWLCLIPGKCSPIQYYLPIKTMIAYIK